MIIDLAALGNKQALGQNIVYIHVHQEVLSIGTRIQSNVFSDLYIRTKSQNTCTIQS